MTVRDWLADRTPRPPVRLRARIEAALGDRADRPSSEASAVSLSAAEELLRDLLVRPTAGRESALDLLTVDALVTYAFEAAATDPSSLAGHASDAMVRLAALA